MILTKNKQNKNILKGLSLLYFELNERVQKEIEAHKLGIYNTYGSVGYKQLPTNFLRFVSLTKTTYTELKWAVKSALSNIGDGHDIEFDGDTLTLFVYHEGTNTTTKIWFDATKIEGYIGAQEFSLDHSVGGSGQTIIMTAREYLRENWQDVAEDYILENLKDAEIEDDQIINIINGLK